MLYPSKRKASINTESVRAELYKVGYTLPEDFEYRNYRTRLRFTCDKGHKQNIAWSSWCLGYRCKTCNVIAKLKFT